MVYQDVLLNTKVHNFFKQKLKHKSYYYNKYKNKNFKLNNFWGTSFKDPDPSYKYCDKGIMRYFEEHYWRRIHSTFYAKRFNFPKITGLKQEKKETDEDFAKKLRKLRVSCRFHRNLTRIKIYNFRKRYLTKYFRKFFFKGVLFKKKIPKIMPVIYYKLRFYKSFKNEFKIKTYEFLRFIKKFFGTFTKKGNKQKLYNIIISALKRVCLKYNFNLNSVLYFIYFSLRPEAYLKPYYFWKTKFFTGDIITNLNKRVSVPCYWIKNGIKECENRTLFLKFVTEFDNFLSNNSKLSKILSQKKIYIEKLKEIRVKDRYPYTNLNIGVKQNNKNHVL